MANPYSKEQKQLSQESLQEALFALMKHESFNSISISALAQKAGISRMAFYRNYDNKEQVLADYFDDYINAFYADLQATVKKGPADISLTYFRYVAAHSELFEVLIASGAENILVERFTHFVSKFYLDNVRTIPFTGDYAHYWNSFVSAGLYQMTMAWIRDGKKATPELLAQIATKVAG